MTSKLPTSPPETRNTIVTGNQAEHRAPFSVDVPEPLLGTLPTRIRTRIWLALAKVAQARRSVPQGIEQLGEGYRAVYAADGAARAVTLLSVELWDLPDASL